VHKPFLEFLNKNLRLSKAGFYLFLIPSVIAVPLATAWSETSYPFFSAMAIGILLTAVTFLIYCGLLVIRNSVASRFEDDYRFASAAIIFIGVCRGFIFYGILELLDYEQPSSLIQRVLNSTLTTVIWLGLANIVVEVNRRYKRKFRAILSQLLVVNLRNSGSAQAGFAVIAHDLALLQTQLQDSYFSVKGASDDSESMRTAAKEIRVQIETALKPLSKRLWLDSMYVYPQLKFLRLIADAIWNLKYPFFPTIAVLTLSTFVNLAPASGATYSIGSGVSLLLSFCLFEFLRRRAVTGVPSLKSSINLMFVSAIGIFTGFASATVLNLFDGGGSYFLALVLAPYISAIVIVGSAITLALSDRQEILSNLSKGAKRLTENTNHSLQSSQAASYIHNSLQSELTALAQQFELVATNPNKRQSEIVLEKLDALIRRSMGEDFSNFLESPESRLDRVLKSWDEIVTLKVNIDRLLFTDAARGMLFVQLVEESLANSVRKGNATEIAIDATFIGSRLEVQIKDNGQFNSENGTGLGTAWIERFSAGEWFITAVEGGTLLKVEL
jgi:hypothetical protein